MSSRLANSLSAKARDTERSICRRRACSAWGVGSTRSSVSITGYPENGEEAKATESRVRHEAAQRIAAFERERAFAFRRLNLMRAIADAVADLENEDVAAARACLELRVKLGWNTDTDARADVLARFAAVGRTVFHNLAPRADAPSLPVEDALTDFEVWYARERGTPFWLLFDQYVVETPLVDF